MSSGEGPSAEVAVRRHALRDHLVGFCGALPVPQLADVEVPLHAVDSFDLLPAQEDVARRLHQVLACHHPLALVGVLALPHEFGEYRCLSFLRLEQQRILPVTADHQDHPGSGADTAHADHLARDANEAELIQEVLAITLQRRPVTADELMDSLRELRALRLREGDLRWERSVADC